MLLKFWSLQFLCNHLTLHLCCEERTIILLPVMHDRLAKQHLPSIDLNDIATLYRPYYIYRLARRSIILNDNSIRGFADVISWWAWLVKQISRIRNIMFIQVYHISTKQRMLQIMLRYIYIYFVMRDERWEKIFQGRLKNLPLFIPDQKLRNRLL